MKKATWKQYVSKSLSYHTHSSTQLRPAIGCPRDRSLDEQGCSFVGNAIAVADEDTFVAKGIGGAMTGSLEFLLVAFENERSASEAHVMAFTVEVRTFDATTAAYSHAVVALGALTAVVP